MGALESHRLIFPFEMGLALRQMSQMGQTVSCEFGLIATVRQECIERRRSLLVSAR